MGKRFQLASIVRPARRTQATVANGSGIAGRFAA